MLAAHLLRLSFSCCCSCSAAEGAACVFSGKLSTASCASSGQMLWIGHSSHTPQIPLTCWAHGRSALPHLATVLAACLRM